METRIEYVTRILKEQEQESKDKKKSDPDEPDTTEETFRRGLVLGVWY